MGMSSQRQTSVDVNGLICIAESEKSYGLMTKSAALQNCAATDQITNYREAKAIADQIIFWLPKSQVGNVQLTDSLFFPNLKINFSSKSNPNLIPYKTEMSCRLPEWLAKEKGLVDTNSEGEIEPDTSSEPSNQGW
jgi:hypothetical protein